MLSLRCVFAGVLLVGLVGAPVVAAPQLQVLLPLARTAYATNEWIDVSVVRSDTAALPASELTLTVSGGDGSRMVFTFPGAAVPLVGPDARATEHLHLNGWLLRPQPYTLEVAENGATAQAQIALFSHIRKSSFKVVNWGRAEGADQLTEGEDSLGYNLFYGPATTDPSNFIRAGVDFMPVCTMGGGHQMDLRPEADWSDPYVIRGGTARVVRQALIDRTYPNVIGIHFYDEPGLTWAKHPVSGEWTAHGVPSQMRSFQSAFDRAGPEYYKVDPKNPADVAQWKEWAIWKLGFMDAAWQDAKFGVDYVRPDYLTATQSQYGWTAFTDGYYFNVVRSLPVVSGHGGYDDYGPGYFNPSLFLEMARAREYAKPNWYLPTWYGGTPPDRFRVEQYLSFITNIQGMITPPEIDPVHPFSTPAAESVVESNKLMARLGPIFTTMPVTQSPVAVLYSMSQLLDLQARDRSVEYAHATNHGQGIVFTYLAGKLMQQPIMPVVDEDVLDGTLAANHKAVILNSVDYLDPRGVTALEDFVAHGGLVLMTSDSTVKIHGAVNVGMTPQFPDAARIQELQATKNDKAIIPLQTMAKQLQGAAKWAAALTPQLDKAGIKPVFQCDNPGIVASREAAGSIEYLFAVNAAQDVADTTSNRVKPTTATIILPADGGPVYDAVVGGPAPFHGQMNGLQGHFRFGPGQLRVFARTARPIGGIKVAPPVVTRNFTSATEPLGVDIATTLLDDHGAVLGGSAPLEIRVVDPIGDRRYDLFRATRDGLFNIRLPLALNDPSGLWKVSVRELLANTSDTVAFQYFSTNNVGAAAGVRQRALFFGHDRTNIFRFFRVHQDVTIVKGSSDYENAAAERLTAILKPWDVRCTIVNASDVNKPRSLTAEEARTWVGLDYASSGTIKPGDGNSPALVGFDVNGPIVLLGTPQDNPLIQFLSGHKFLPYAPDKMTFPGRGRGMLAWQMEGVGHGQESVTLIAYDAAGMSEAVGSLYEAVAGMDPLTPLIQPSSSSLSTPSMQPPRKPGAMVAWSVTLPDRASAMTIAANGVLAVRTLDGSETTLDGSGKTLSQKVAPVEAASAAATAPVLSPVQTRAELSGHIVKRTAASNGLTAIGYWGGEVQVMDVGGVTQYSESLPQDITVLGWLGKRLVVGLADGRIMALESGH